MVKFCSACNCTNRFKKAGIRFHQFLAKDKELCNKWVVATRLQSLHVAESSMLCENHFKPEDYNNPLDPKSRLKKDSIPSSFNIYFSASTSTKRKSLQPNV